MHLAVQNRTNRGGKNTKPLFLSVGDKHRLTAKQCVLTVQLRLNYVILILHVYGTCSVPDTDSMTTCICTALNFTILVLKLPF